MDLFACYKVYRKKYKWFCVYVRYFSASFSSNYFVNTLYAKCLRSNRTVLFLCLSVFSDMTYCRLCCRLSWLLESFHTEIVPQSLKFCLVWWVKILLYFPDKDLLLTFTLLSRHGKKPCHLKGIQNDLTNLVCRKWFDSYRWWCYFF